MFTLYHFNDPAAPRDADGRAFDWPFVYLHGLAEDVNEGEARSNGWAWAAPDLFVADAPMPGPGEYEGSLYGEPLLIVLAFTAGRGFLRGRIAAKADADAASHARSPEDWR